MGKGEFCTFCKKIIVLPEVFRLHDPYKYDVEKERPFYRYENCRFCFTDYKVEYFTTLGRESGANIVDFEEGILGGFVKEDFDIAEVIPETRYDAQIFRIVQKNKIINIDIKYNFKITGM